MGLISRMLRRGPKPDKETAAINALRRHGVDLARPIAIRHYLYFARDYEARVVAAELGAQGFETDVNLVPMNAGLLVLARRAEVMDPEALRALRAKMDELADSQKGEYDGWEAEVVGTTVPGAEARR
jgi:hypothetical protein